MSETPVCRVHIFVEGQTEETFVRELLYESLRQHGIYLNPILVRTGAVGKGGLVSYAKIKPQLNRKCLEDPTAWVTTLFDMYRLPGDFPGSDSLSEIQDPFQKAEHLECQMAQDIGRRNFLPHLLVHEFEGLLYTDPEAFGEWFDERVVQQLFAERQQFASPEHINDGPTTAPSKRIARCCPGYSKPLHGSLIALSIGLEGIRQQCHHFDAWLTRLVRLAQGTMV